MSQFDIVCFRINDHVGRPPVTVPLLTDASRIEYHHLVEFPPCLYVGVARHTYLLVSYEGAIKTLRRNVF